MTTREKAIKNRISRAYQESIFGCEVIRVVCKDFGYPEEDVFKKSRYRKYVHVRQICHYIIKKCTKQISLEKIGSLPYHTGYNRDHATVLHSVKTTEGYLDYDYEIIEYISRKMEYFKSIFPNYVSKQDILSLRKAKIFELIERAETEEDLTLSLISIIA